MSAELAYTWSHDIDDVPRGFGGGPALGYVWEMPLGKGKRYLTRGGLADWVLGGWQTNGILTIQSGLPFSPVLNTSTTNTGTGSRPNYSGAKINYPHTLQQWFDPSVFSIPAPYTYGNAGRDILFGPGRVNWDMSLFKDFVIHEQTRFEFRAEAFNVFNHPQFGCRIRISGTPRWGRLPARWATRASSRWGCGSSSKALERRGRSGALGPVLAPSLWFLYVLTTTSLA